MIRNRKSKTKYLIVSCIAALAIFASANASAAWYVVKVGAVITQSNTGDTVVRMKPGTGNTAFTGVGRGLVDASDDGANELLALILSAIALGQEISVEMADLPTAATIGVIRSAALIAPSS